MVTAATTASSVSPLFFRMSIPAPSAWSPLALEIISGRLPCAAGAKFARAAGSLPFACEAPNNLPALATALPASEVRKNLRRDHSSMGSSSSVCGGNIQQLTAQSSVMNQSGGFVRPQRFERRAASLDGGDGLRGEFAFPACNHDA